MSLASPGGAARKNVVGGVGAGWGPGWVAQRPFSPYALQAHRMTGVTVSAAQGSERRVVIYIVVAYGKDKMSLSDNVFNTAGTRAISLFIVVADTDEIIRIMSTDSGVRKVMLNSPIVPLEVFLELLTKASKVNSLHPRERAKGKGASARKRKHESAEASQQ